MAKVQTLLLEIQYSNTYSKVLVGTCVKRIEEGAAEVAGQSISINNKTGLPIDTYTDDTQTVFFKVQFFLKLRTLILICLVPNV